MKKSLIIIVFSLLCFSCHDHDDARSTISSESTDKAEMFYKNNLHDEAKKVLISTIYSNTAHSQEIEKALYLLGNIALKEKNIEGVTKAWKKLYLEYPNSKYINIIKNTLDSFSNSAIPDENTDAEIYFQRAEILVESLNDTPAIDTSFIGESRIADEWYDEIIQKYPGTQSARDAYLKKMNICINESTNLPSTNLPGGGRDVNRLKAEIDKIFVEGYINALINIFNDFKKSFPKSVYIRRYNFYIAQRYELLFQFDKSTEVKSKMLTYYQFVIDNSDDDVLDKISRHKVKYYTEEKQKSPR